MLQEPCPSEFLTKNDAIIYITSNLILISNLRITGAMGKGLAALTFDEEYQRKRRQGIHNKPKNFHEGLARSSKGLVMVRIIFMNYIV